MKLVSVSEMKAIEQQADARGLSYAHMMENAGQGLADVIHDLKSGADWEDVLGLVGPGNNGGDTLVALAHLALAGWRARAYCVKRKPALRSPRRGSGVTECKSRERSRRASTRKTNLAL